jgi:hypothetical protein
MFLGIQILGILFALFMVYFTYLHFKRKEFGSLEFRIWIVLWLGLIFITIFPNSLDFLIKNVLSLQRPLDFFIICGFLFLVFITFLNYSTTKKNKRNIEKIVSAFAHKETKKSTVESNESSDEDKKESRDIEEAKEIKEEKGEFE